MARGAFVALTALVAGDVARADNVPRGHLQPFGAWKDGTPVEELTRIPEPRDFYDTYCNSDGGAGRPVVFRGAALNMRAMDWGDDEAMVRKFAKEEVTGVEYNLKETRAGGQVKGIKRLGQFIEAYNTSDMYMVSQVPKGMMRDVSFLPCLRCGGFLNFLDVNNMWMGAGGSKSVIHYDDQDNINCMISGRKRFLFMHPKYKEQFEAHPNSAKNKFGWVDTDLDQSVPGYGAFFGGVDVDKVDLLKYPGWSDIYWSFADLEAGDCVYIPYQWYHQVTAEPVRSINVHIWYWRPKKFDQKSCDAKATAPTPAFSDCTWGYEPPDGHLGVLKKGGPKPTRCKTKAAEQEL